MRNVISSQQRRRRLRLIQTMEERSAKQARAAVSALTIASDTESVRLDVDAIRRQLIVECRVNVSASLRVEHDGATRMNVLLDRPFLLIGSDPSCDLQLSHEDVKPQHYYLQWIDGRLFCCDVGPRNSLHPDRYSGSTGQWMDEQPIPIGPFRLTLVNNQNSLAQIRQGPDQAADSHRAIDVLTRNPSPEVQENTPLDRSSRLSSEYPLLALQFDGVEQSDNVWPVNRPLTMIGRGPQCKLRLNHESMAYVQACLLRTANGCWLIDLAKDGATCVNGRVIPIAPVDVGDVLQLGVFQVEVVTMTVPTAAPGIGSDRAKKSDAAKKIRSGSEESLLPIKFDRSADSDARSSKDISEPNHVPQRTLETTQSMKTDVRVNEATVVEFVKQQQQQLAALKKQLDALKQIDAAAEGELDSKRMHETLGKPVIETLECYESMQESLARFMQSVEH